MSDRIEKTIELRAPIEHVWRALTDAKEFGEWFRVKLDGPFTAGATSTGHMTYPGYQHLKWAARVKQMEAPRLFSFEWHPFAIDPKVDYSHEHSTLVEFRLEPTSIGTRLTVVESGFAALPSHRRDEAWRMNDRGWSTQIENVRAHVER